MKLTAKPPTVNVVIDHFEAMLAGKVQKKLVGRGRTRLFGTWSDRGHTTTQPIKLITPVAMDIEQAKSKIRRSKTTTPLPSSSTRKRTQSNKKPPSKPLKKKKTATKAATKKTLIKGGRSTKRSHSTPKGRRSSTKKVHLQLDNFS